MTLDPVERLNYYQFQYVGAEEFRAQQAYHRDALRRHDLGPHSTGIVSGLTIKEVEREGDPGFVDIYVLPGMAVDGFGRQILVLEPAKVDAELFAAFDTDRHLELWLRYDETPNGAATGGFAPCIDASAYSRIVESFRFLVGTLNPERDAIMVGGDEAKPASQAGPDDPVEPADASIAYQDFPDDDRMALWAVRLGSVHWDGTVGKFRPAADPGRLIEGRTYAGFVGSSVLAEGAALRLGPRTAAVDPDAADFATIEGRLTVDGRIVAKRDLLVHGGSVSWQSAGGSDETVPLWMQRLPKPSGSGADLRIHIGDAANADTRLTIGPGPAPMTLGTEKVVLAVRGDDRVDIPSGRLRFKGDARQLIDLSVEVDGKAGMNAIGRHGGSVYYRSAGDHYWYQQGEHENKDGDPGAGGVKLMHLGVGGLYFADSFRQFLNAEVSGQKAGIGSQEQTLYFRSPGHFAWYRGGGPSPAELNAGGGTEAMRLDSASRLTVDGGITSRGSMQLWGSAIEFRNAAGETDTDPLQISRFQRSGDNNDLRVVIGDNVGGEDRFTVGPIHFADGLYKDQFVVENNGNVRIAGDLYVGSQKALVDVQVGEVFLNRQSAGTGTQSVTVTSKLPKVSDVSVVLALSDIGNVNVATDARWGVILGTITKIPPNSAKFDVNWTVKDIDGQLFRFTYVAVMRP